MAAKKDPKEPLTAVPRPAAQRVRVVEPPAGGVVSLPSGSRSAGRPLRLVGADDAPGIIRLPKPLPPKPAEPEKPAAKDGERHRLHVLLPPESSRYRFERIIGDGGTSTVFKALDMLLNMPVAIKVLKRELCEDAEAVASLKQEARIAMQLSHSHIVRLYDLQHVGRRYMLIMEYVEGYSLRDVLSRYGCLSTDTVLDIVDFCTDALTYAHGRGVLHNDLKPDNLLLTTDGVLKIVDFGTARLINRAIQSRYVYGTPVYMSPEQVRGEPLDARTDVYALGMTVYELLTRRTPYPMHATIDDLLHVPREPLTGLEPPALAVIEQALAVNREDRWPGVAALRDALFRAAGRDAPGA